MKISTVKQKIIRTLAGAAVALCVAVAPTANARAADWDFIAGGISSGHWVLHTDLQFAGMVPTAGFSYGVSDRFEIGLSAGISAPVQFSGGDPWNTGLGVYATIPLRFSFVNNGAHSAALKFAPGFAAFAGAGGGTWRGFGVPLNLSFNYGYWAVAHSFMIGLGVDAPLMIALTPVSGFTAPIVAGPMAEIHFTDHFGIYSEIKVGPMFDTTGRFVWSQRLVLGISAQM